MGCFNFAETHHASRTGTCTADSFDDPVSVEENGCFRLDEVLVEENGCFSSAELKVTADSFDDSVSVEEIGCFLSAGFKDNTADCSDPNGIGIVGVDPGSAAD